jgi:hypothetical protein
MPDKPKILPPDADLQRLAARVNAKLDPGVAVSFFRVVELDGSTETGIVYQCGDRRACKRTRNALGDGDEDSILRAIQTWVARVQYQHRWTIDPKEAE